MGNGLSVGTDIVDVARIARMIKNRRFLERVFTPEEIRYCKNKKNAAQHFAVRFAAKEAVWKCLSSLAQTQGISHKEISVRRAADGRPSVALSPRLKRLEKGLALSLSHTREYALAMAVCRQ